MTKLDSTSTCCCLQVSPNWPSRGSIDFDNVSVRYRPSLPQVLEQVSIAVKPAEKIGSCLLLRSASYPLASPSLLSLLYRNYRTYRLWKVDYI